MRAFLTTLLTLSTSAIALTAEESGKVEALIRAYPAQLSHIDGESLVWKDGTRMALKHSGATNYVALLNTAELLDQLDATYPGCSTIRPPAFNNDPGRVRYEPFFQKMYGTSPAQVKSHLKSVNWFGQPVMVTEVNGVAESLKLVAQELASDKSLRSYLSPSAGTFLWRNIAGTPRLSMHAYGAAIDLNTKYSAYWKWNGYREGQQGIRFRNQIPLKVVEAFERHGWVWGGRWYHYDTMHFEYRPELAGCRK